MAMECKEHYKLPSFSSFEELEELLEEGYQDILDGRVYTLDEVIGELSNMSIELEKSDYYGSCETKLAED